MLAVSRSNYAGAEALDQLHRLHAREGDSKVVLRVHMDTLTCMTGVTRFLQIPPPSPQGSWGSDVNAEVMWIYDKSEDATQLLHPGFWEQFDYALAERAETVIGKWEIVGTVEGYAGVAVVKPGEGMMRSSGDAVADSSWWRWFPTRWLELFQTGARKWLTRGWWLQLRSEPKIRILRKQRPGLEV